MLIKILKFLGIFSLGAATGALVTHKVLKKKLEEQANEDLKECRDIFRKRLDEVIAQKEVKIIHKEKIDDTNEIITEDVSTVPKDIVENFKTYSGANSEDSTDYTSYSSNLPEGKISENKTEKSKEKKIEKSVPERKSLWNRDDYPEVYIISEEEFETSEYDKVEIQMFCEGVMASKSKNEFDAFTEQWDPWDAYIPESAISKFEYSDDTCICFRNVDNACEYRIVKTTESYHDATGMIPEL